MGSQAFVALKDRTDRLTRFRCRATARLALIALMVVSSEASLVGQTGGGATLVGTVKDSSGSLVTGAKVRVVNTETAFLTETVTLTDGSYYVPYLTPGSYKVT